VTLTRNENALEIFSDHPRPYHHQGWGLQGSGRFDPVLCQKFGHVWASCRQPPRCMWYGEDHLHREFTSLLKQ
jgi:hypothetical protein